MNICKKRFMSAHIILKAIAALAVLVFSGIAYARENGHALPNPPPPSLNFDQKRYRDVMCLSHGVPILAWSGRFEP